MLETVTPFGAWLIKQICRVPVIRTLPLRSSLFKCREIVLVRRSIRKTWGDWYIPPDAKMRVLWKRRPG